MDSLGQSGWQPEPFLTHRDVTIFHAYKDEFSDIPLGNWYSTTDSALAGSEFEFDIRDLQSAIKKRFGMERVDDEELIRKAIDEGILQTHDAPRLS